MSLLSPSDPGLWAGEAGRHGDDGLRGDALVPSTGGHPQLDALHTDGWVDTYSRVAEFVNTRRDPLFEHWLSTRRQQSSMRVTVVSVRFKFCSSVLCFLAEFCFCSPLLCSPSDVVFVLQYCVPCLTLFLFSSTVFPVWCCFFSSVLPVWLCFCFRVLCSLSVFFLFFSTVFPVWLCFLFSSGHLVCGLHHGRDATRKASVQGKWPYPFKCNFGPECKTITRAESSCLKEARKRITLILYDDKEQLKLENI